MTDVEKVVNNFKIQKFFNNHEIAYAYLSMCDELNELFAKQSRACTNFKKFSKLLFSRHNDIITRRKEQYIFFKDFESYVKKYNMNMYSNATTFAVKERDKRNIRRINRMIYKE